MTIVFWITLVLVLYVYFGYPIVLTLIGALTKRRAVAKSPIEPKVTLIISAYNEEQVIEAKLRNSLALDYPKTELEVLVVSDCSTDRTDEIVNQFSGQGIALRRMVSRRGKTSGLNETVPRAIGEIIVFSDANALYRADALRKLIRNFNDPDVGCVTGESRYIESGRSPVGSQEGLYWKYERLLKIFESRVGSMVGGDGAIFALREQLYEPLDETDINDFIIPLQVVKRGYRCVYEPEAICEERGTVQYREEFRRKVRIVNRSVHALRKMTSLLNPFRYGWFSLQLFSHKILRWAMGAWLGALFVANLYLRKAGLFFSFLAYAQIAFYVMALLGVLLSAIRVPGVSFVTVPYYFCLVNAAALIGIFKSLTGRVQSTWTPERGQTRDPSGSPFKRR